MKINKIDHGGVSKVLFRDNRTTSAFLNFIKNNFNKKIHSKFKHRHGKKPQTKHRHGKKPQTKHRRGKKPQTKHRRGKSSHTKRHRKKQAEKTQKIRKRIKTPYPKNN